MDNVTRQVVIVGAGPVGCLATMAFAKRGWKVNLYEGRPGIYLVAILKCCQSLNKSDHCPQGVDCLGLALEAVYPSLLPMLLQEAIPLRGRMLYTTTGKPVSRVYDTKHMWGRALLNKRLLDVTEAAQNVRLLFNHKVTGADFNQKIVNN